MTITLSGREQVGDQLSRAPLLPSPDDTSVWPAVHASCVCIYQLQDLCSYEGGALSTYRFFRIY